MGKFIDLTGQKFGRLTVVERAGTANYGGAKWLCVCDCGNEIIVRSNNLCSGNTKSCGCYNREMTIKLKTKHGGRKTRLYRIWQGIKRRCYDENDIDYKYYGEHGILMCEAWKDSFEAFKDWAVENGYSDSLTIDRIDVNGNYEPSNCRWTTMKEQQNNRTNNHFLTYNGETKTMAQWAEELGLSYYVIRTRIRLGWTVGEALSTPVGEPRNKPESI